MIEVYSDGSSHARGGKPGGWAFVALRDNVPLSCGYGGHPSTTNNLMELEGAIQGLKRVEERGLRQNGERVILVADSKYVLGLGIGSYNPSTNLEKAQELQSLFKRMKVGARHVRGHTGNPWNERCDRLAKKGKIEAMRFFHCQECGAPSKGFCTACFGD